MSKRNLFEKKEKDLTMSVHYSIRRSLVKKINTDAKEYSLSASKIVDTIIADYYERTKK